MLWGFLLSYKPGYSADMQKMTGKVAITVILLFISRFSKNIEIQTFNQ